jgi:hypothetical protein
MNWDIKKNDNEHYKVDKDTGFSEIATYFEVQLWYALETEEGRAAYYQGEFDYYFKECSQADDKIAVLTKNLEELTALVDDALLLDEELHQAWNDLHLGVIKARKALESK